jgi:chemotaxis protein methyltransferase CheR
MRQLFVGNDLPDEELDRVRDILLASRGFDLRPYKDRCIRRRIAARVRARGFSAAAPYIDILTRDVSEVDRLLTALTIHISQFFRNPSTFAELGEKILPELIGRADRLGTPVRIWSVGCASGEEPYSMALLLEEMETPPAFAMTIRATDVSSAILEEARAGIFDGQRLESLPAHLRQRHFLQEGGRSRIAGYIREKVSFELHDLLADNDYPAADLILCRNVLIYFSRREQEKILLRLAAALPNDGFLVLGRAEVLLGEARRLFGIESAAERIYRCRPQRAEELLKI